ncbi:hypothetical protein KMW28_21480 [Flammeovirga yaeyamensis]|uniref:Transcription regulator TrmB N-terminal domain-containing protein n=1 Tax=Flammeovirga yaeyamensis TaxID=367791 RepID=A0AAX1NCQ6_9BACT|nr:helix-turn-helix domain-containing protein [Flammeovirga yaeyamensis]MBB3697075.1 sugar-specific transcriptional regulator TrmB [Flammeovirga yaeyamensis]NMF33737.1 hypothetical protein [Flammeovirga yaeyamensis]QWG04997.1 hypothetical protein KMW28_21480 [Flammeovirga yaeyamensis]
MDELLINIGFSQQELKIYKLLLEKGELSVTDISRLTSIPTSKLYAFMDTLTDKGFCRLVKDRPKIYALNSPNSAFNRVRDEYIQKEKALQKLSNELEEKFLQTKSNTTSVFRTITNPKEILEEYYRLFRMAKKIGVGFSKAPYTVNIEELENVNPSEEESINNGVEFKGIYELPKGENETNIKRLANYFKSKGEDVKMIESLPFKMLMVDFQYVLILLHGGNGLSLNMALTVDDKDFATSMYDLFQLYWEKADYI